MYRHKSVPFDEYMHKLKNELNKYVELQDGRQLVLVVHLYVEYWLNELIIKVFPNHEIILDEDPRNDLKGFYNKCKLLEAAGVISNSDTLLNLKILNKVRNLYAHTLNYQEIYGEVKEEVSKMIFCEKLRIKMEETDIEHHDMEKLQSNAFSYLEFCAISTILKLYEIYEKVKKFPNF